jgi:invasion protein IalB
VTGSVVPNDKKERFMELGKFARLAVIAATAGLVAGPALAQQKPDAAKPAEAAPAPAAPAGGAAPAEGGDKAAAAQPNWVKICNTDPTAKKEVCLISRDVRTDTGQNVASVAIRQITGENKRFFLAAVPPGLLIQPGVRIAVDQNTPATGKYSICFPNACYAEVEINDAFFKNMQKGNNLVVQAMNQQAKTINFPVSLGGFSKAVEGPAMDRKAFADSRKELNEGLNRRAQEAKDKLQVPSGAQQPDDGGAAPGGKAQVPAR